MRDLAVRLGLAGLLVVSLLLTVLFLLRSPNPPALLTYIHDDNGEARIQVYDLDRAVAHPVLDLTAVYNPAWSPNGRWLTFLHISAPGEAQPG